MKTKVNFLSTITLLFFIMAACGGQTSRTDTRDNLADVREDLQEVIQTIDKALATNDISDFKSKTDDAVSSLDSKIDDYLNDMDKADRRVDQNTRNQIIDMKQKKVELEFKLALLEHDDTDNWGDGDRDRRQDRTDTRTGDDRTATGARQTATVGDHTATGTRQTATGDRDRRREILYGPQLVEDMKKDLRDLRGKVEQFAQSLPREAAN